MAELRRDFLLLDEDVHFLNGLKLDWEAVQDANQRVVIIYGFLLPSIFQPEKVGLKIKVPADYTAGAALDMFFTNVRVTRADGHEIPRLTDAGQFDGKQWWQWSRHYPNGTKWRPGIDNLGTHLSFVQYLLDEEAKGKVWQ